MSLIKEYFALASKYTSEYGENTIVLLQVGAFSKYTDKSQHRTTQRIVMKHKVINQYAPEVESMNSV